MKTNDRTLSPTPDEPEFQGLSGWEDTAAAVTLTAPGHRAPARCLMEIKSRLSHLTRASSPPASLRKAEAGGFGPVVLNGHTHPARKRPAWLGYGLAAALAVFGGWQSVRVIHLNSEIIALKSNTTPKPDTTINSTDRNPSANHDGTPSDPFSPPDKSSLPNSRALAAESIVVPDRAALQRQLDELQRLNDAHFQPVPGLARTVVMELQTPGSKPTTPIRTPTLSAEVAGIIAAGIDKGRTGAKPPLSLSGASKARPGDEIVIESGLPNLAGFTLQPDATLFHKDFPADTWQQWEGLHLLKNGSFYDELNNILWKPVPGEGRRYSGRTPEQPVLLEEQAAPRDAGAPAHPASPVNDAPDSQPLIWSIYDESRGEGRLVVSDLPPAPDGKAYQLWFEDARSPTPITAGLFPPLENGSGQVWFDLTPGVSPVNYRLTLEPAAGSATPLGPVVLTGP